MFLVLGVFENKRSAVVK